MPTAASNTVAGIIKDAMVDAGYLDEAQNPNSEQLATYQRRLCDIINFEQTQGLKLFFLQDLSIDLIANQNLYQLKPTGGAINMVKPMRVLQGYILNTDGETKRPLVDLSWNEWINLSQNEGNSGAINSYFVDKQATSLNVYVWQEPDTNEALNTLHLLIQVAAPNPASLEENVSFPQEWRLFLRWALADDISTGQPQAIMSRCSAKAEYYREQLENWDVEDTETRFTPDQRNQYGYGKFTV